MIENCRIIENRIIEINFDSDISYKNPFSDTNLRVVFKSPSGNEYEVHAFWDGDSRWTARFYTDEKGKWEWRSISGNENDKGLHDRYGCAEIGVYKGVNPVYRHGFLKISENKKGFLHKDGTPFFWLADTAWGASSKAVKEEWSKYLDKRNNQGFNVIQMNSLPIFDEKRIREEPFYKGEDDKWDLSRPNPKYFRRLDKLIRMSLEKGIFTALVVLWSAYVPSEYPDPHEEKRRGAFDEDSAALYAQYLAARFSSYGVIWLISGDTKFNTDICASIYNAAGSSMKNSIKKISLIGSHVNTYTTDLLNNMKWLDFHMYQSGHKPSISKAAAVKYTSVLRSYSPARPILNSEPCYEDMSVDGSAERAARKDVREVSWISILSGANAGITYGAHGLWLWHRRGDIFYRSHIWGSPVLWEEALCFKGAEDIGILGEFMREIQWLDIKPAGHLLCNENKDVTAAILSNDDTVIVYIANKTGIKLKSSPGSRYEAYWFNPVTGDRVKVKTINEEGILNIEESPWQADAVCIIERH